MLEDTSFADVVSWGPQGDCFVVKDMNEFTKSILPRMFKHSNFASFVRQLNKYDFHKVRSRSFLLRVRESNRCAQRVVQASLRAKTSFVKAVFSFGVYAATTSVRYEISIPLRLFSRLFVTTRLTSYRCPQVKNTDDNQFGEHVRFLLALPSHRFPH